MNTLCISQKDMALFSVASHDVNPLHISEAYARRTPFGEPVVFGILGALLAAGNLPERTGWLLAKVAFDFRNPLFREVTYRVAVTEKSEETTLVEIFDGRRLMSSLGFTFQRGNESLLLPDGVPSAYLLKPAQRGPEDLPPGFAVAGHYIPDPEKLSELKARCGLEGRGLSDAQIVALMGTSYLVGMEFPGERAAYSRLQMTFAEGGVKLSTAELGYQGTVTSFDTRFGLLRFGAQFACGDPAISEAQIWAFVRPETPPSAQEALNRLLPPSDSLRGKVALVIGGSRGLGAALVLALASQGCTVLLNYLRSREEAEAVTAVAPVGSGPIELVQGDASDPLWNQNVAREISERFERLDILICNASPAIRPMDLSIETLERLQTFVAQSLGLVATPTAQFMESLNQNAGWNVVISSEYAQTTPADFPHYAAAKCAIEGLIRATSGRFSQAHCLLVRPPKLLTDQTNTPMGRQGALETGQVAAAVVGRLIAASPAQPIELMETFDGHTDA